MLSGQQDSNLRPPAPKAGALAGLRYAPIDLKNFFTTSVVFGGAKLANLFTYPNF